MTYIAETYHKSMVVDYYLYLLIRFGATAVRKHIPEIKKLVWSKGGLALVERHKLKRENRGWSA
jgi:hypothetical protein